MAGEQIEPVEPVEPEGVGSDGKMDTEAVADDLARSMGALEEEPNEEPPAPDTPAVEAKPAEVAPAPAEKPEWMPDTWRAPAKAKWSGIDPEIKAEIQKRENDVAKFVNEAQPAIGVSKALGEVLTPYQGIFRQYNINPIEHIGNLLQAHTQLVFGTPEQKLAMFKGMAKDAGFNLASLTDPNASAVDPNHEYIRRLEQKVNSLEGNVTGVTATIREARTAELSSKIAELAADTEHYPHFWDVAPAMVKLMDQKAVSTLEDAYQTAIVADPIYRSKLVEADVAKQLAERQAKERERVAAARKASGASIRSRSGGKSSPPPETIEDTLRSTLSDIRSRTH